MNFRVVLNLASFFILCCNKESVTSYTRQLFHEVYLNTNVSILNLRNSLVVRPTGSWYYKYATLFDVPANLTNYSQRVRGWFVTPLNGYHTFYTSCDDFCELYLSYNIYPFNIRRLVSQTTWSDRNQWNKYPTMQSSPPIQLMANYSYYIEMVMFNADTPDGCSLGVKLPNDTFIGPIPNELMSFMREANPLSPTSKSELCVYVVSYLQICTCHSGFYGLNSLCQDINECIDGTHNCYGEKTNCINTIGGYYCSCDNECWILDEQGRSCGEKVTNYSNCKANLNVNFTGTFDGKLLALYLEIHHFNDSLVHAHSVMFEYFLPSYIALSSERLNQEFTGFQQRKLKYFFTPTFTFSSRIIHSINSTILTTYCSAEVFTILVPLKVTFRNLDGTTFVLFKMYQKKASFPCSKSLKNTKILNALQESYGRGMYWDKTNLLVYVCMNQHVISTETACYRSNDDGQVWADLDMRLGSVIGRHLLTNELYAIHRNQKAYLVFRRDSHKWFSLTNEQYIQNVSRYIDYTFWKNLEGDEDQIFTLGSKKWMGNSHGLYFWNTAKKTWSQRVKWT